MPGPLPYIDDATLAALSEAAFDSLPKPRRVLLVPPDATRPRSRAAILLQSALRVFGDRVKAIMPALGTHSAMTPSEIRAAFGDVPLGLFVHHDYQKDLAILGTLREDEVDAISHGAYRGSWSCEVNKALTEGYDLVVSIGQVVPHEVAGMANYTKNIVVGLGGAATISVSHWVGALWGIERTMGEVNTPVRALFDAAQRNFLSSASPILYALTVIGPQPRELGPGDACVGFFHGFNRSCFERAAALSSVANILRLPRPLSACVARVHPHYKSTWLANKAIYRLRRAMQDGGTLYIIAPGVDRFGESPRLDGLIREYGYRGTAEIRALVEAGSPLSNELAAAAHLIHGSTEGRFKVVYAADEKLREDIARVGYGYMSLEDAGAAFPVGDGETGFKGGIDAAYFEVIDPASGLWIA